MKKAIIAIICLSVIFSGNILAGEYGEVDIHGFISQGYLKTEKIDFFEGSEDGTFQFNEMGINFSTELNSKLRLGMQFFARDLSNIGNDEIKVDWAFADYAWKDYLGIRAGRLKIPFGFFNETRDMDMLRTSIFIPYSVYNETYRDAFSGLKGVGLYGEISLGVAGSIDYQLLGGVSDVDRVGGFSMVATQYGFSLQSDWAVDSAFSGNFQWITPIDGLRIGTSKFEAEMEVPVSHPSFSVLNLILKVDVEFSTYSVEYVWNDLTVISEYTAIEIKADISDVSDTIDSEGYYSGASYRFLEWFELGGYYSEYYDEKDDKDGDRFDENKFQAWQKDSCLSLRFDINENWIAKLEGHKMDGTAQVTTDDVDKERDWSLYLVKFTYSF